MLRVVRAPVVEFRILGTLKLIGGGGHELHSVLAQPKRVALLAYLAAASPRRFHRRDSLVALFWPDLDQEHARAALRQSLHILRRSLGEGALESRGDDEIGLREANFWCDALAFETAVETGRYADALELYRGDLLDGFFISGAPEFEHWLEDERRRLRSRASDAAWAFAEYCREAGDKPLAAHWARRGAAISRDDEGALRRLIALLGELGDRAGALQVYDTFSRRLAKEYEIEPDAETRALIAAVRVRKVNVVGPPPASTVASPNPTGSLTQDVAGAGASLSTVSESAVTDAPDSLTEVGLGTLVAERPHLEPHPKSPAPLTVAPAAHRTRLGRGLALGGLLMALVGGLVIARPRARPSLDPNLVAVAPFEVLDPKLELWREGLVDVLARSLDGAGPFRTVSPTVVIRRWQGRGDRESAAALGYRTHAGFVVFGELFSAGPDSVRLTGALLDTRKGRILAEIDRTDQASRIDHLADSVSLDVIRMLMPTTPGTHIRLYSVGTRSLPALKAFLQGEQFLRRFALDSAIASYDRAGMIDTSFALALRRLQWALGWSDSATSIDYFGRAAAANHGLSPRDSLLVLSDAGPAGRASVPDHPAFYSRTRRGAAVLEEAARRYPEDPDVWYQLGEARFHGGFVFGASWNDARAAFDRAIALDSGFAPAYIHPVEIALNENDAEAALPYIGGYLAISGVTPERGAMRLLSKLLDSPDAPAQDLSGELETASPAALRRLALAVYSWPDANETQIKVWARALASGPGHLNAAVGYYWPPPYASTLPIILIHRGHLQEARRVLGNRFGVPFMQLAELEAISPEAVEAALEQWLRYRGPENLSLYPLALPCFRTLEAALWWASRKDTMRLRYLEAREDAAPPADTTPRGSDAISHPVPGLVRAALSLAAGDTAKALTRFLAFPDSLCPDAPRLREIRFRLLAASRREREAAAVFDRSHDRWVPLVLERARIAERLGDRPTAVKYYRFVAQAWLHADPELQPVVAEARASIVRLAGAPSR
jgi:serine/threonine-protein kinase